MNDKEIIDWLHTNIHSLRLLGGYKPSQFEHNVALMISERFAETCDECKDAAKRLKYPQIQANSNILDKLFGGKK